MEKIKFHLENNRIVEVLATPDLMKVKRSTVLSFVWMILPDRERMIEELRQAKLLAEQYG